MFAGFSRYITAFWRALQLTLRGETIVSPPDAHPELTLWMQQALDLTHAVFASADAHGLDEAARKAFTLHLDKRDIAMQTILAAVKHNLTREYPLLRQSQVEHYAGAIQALNLNDRYRVGQLAQALGDYPQVQRSTDRLHQHLETLPSLPASA